MINFFIKESDLYLNNYTLKQPILVTLQQQDHQDRIKEAIQSLFDEFIEMMYAKQHFDDYGCYDLLVEGSCSSPYLLSQKRIERTQDQFEQAKMSFLNTCAEVQATTSFSLGCIEQILVKKHS
jgi:hypothetical protein